MPLAQLHTFTDDYFVVAHDPDTAQPRLNHAALGYGLAAGLLCELILYRWIGIRDKIIYPFGYSEVPAEPLQHRVYDLIRAEKQRWPIDYWLRFIAKDAVDMVGDRLVRTRRHKRETIRVGLLRRAVDVYRPVDPAREAYVAIRLGALVRDPQPKLEDIIVLALAVATEVTDALDLSEDRESRERMRHLFGRLPEPLWEVVTHTQAAIAHHVMTR